MVADSRTRFIEHRGTQILLLDYTNIVDKETALREIATSRRIIAQQPPGSLLTLTHVAGSRYDADVVQALKELTLHNRPYVKAAAVVGLNPLMRVIYRAVTAFSKRDIHVFDELEAAKDWLQEQA